MPSNYRNDKKKRAEAEDNLKKNVRKAFDATLSGYREKIANASPDEIEKIIRQDPTVVRLAVLMKEKHLETLGELDVPLRQYGTSLEQQIRDFGEYQMGLEAARKKMK